MIFVFNLDFFVQKYKYIKNKIADYFIVITYYNSILLLIYIINTCISLNFFVS